MLIFLFLTSFVVVFPPAKPEVPPAPVQEKPSLSEEEIERKCKSIIDEFLHINDFKVSKMKTSLNRQLRGAAVISVQDVSVSTQPTDRAQQQLQGHFQDSCLPGLFSALLVIGRTAQPVGFK